MKIHKEFPKGLFPPVIEDFVHDAARAQGLCTDYLYNAYISVLSVLIGNRYAVHVTGPWIERPLVWVALIGQSGIKKTPAIKLMFSPLNEIEKMNYLGYKQSLKEYEEAVKAGDVGRDKPISQQMIVDDTTMEALCDVLGRNTSGVIMKKDELMTLIFEAGRYSKSNGSEERLLSIFSGESISINRKGNDLHDLIDRPFVSLIGGVQPEVLKKLFADGRSENGFVNRLLFALPEVLVRTMPQYSANDEFAANYQNHIRMAYVQNEKNTTGDESPILLPMSTEALKAFKAWQRDFNYRKHFDVSYDGYLSKLEAYAVRLAFIVEYSWSVLIGGKPESISLDSMNKALEMCSYYFQSYQRARRIQEETTGGQKEDKIKVLMEKVILEFHKGKSKKEIVLKLLKQGYSNSAINKATQVAKSTISLYANEL
jgi:hypothetical protein